MPETLDLFDGLDVAMGEVDHSGVGDVEVDEGTLQGDAVQVPLELTPFVRAVALTAVGRERVQLSGPHGSCTVLRCGDRRMPLRTVCCLRHVPLLGYSPSRGPLVLGGCESKRRYAETSRSAVRAHV